MAQQLDHSKKPPGAYCSNGGFFYWEKGGDIKALLPHEFSNSFTDNWTEVPVDHNPLSILFLILMLKWITGLKKIINKRRCC